jgi:hypothetical protein
MTLTETGNSGVKPAQKAIWPRWQQRAASFSSTRPSSNFSKPLQLQRQADAMFRRAITFVIVTTMFTALYLNYQRNALRKFKVLEKNCILGPSTFNFDKQPLPHPCYQLLSMRSPDAFPTYSQVKCPAHSDKRALERMSHLLCTYGMRSKKSSIRSTLACWYPGDTTVHLPSCLREVCRIVPLAETEMYGVWDYHVECGIPYKAQKPKKSQLSLPFLG